MDQHRKLVHVTQMPIRWGDQDALGHVNNTVYFRYMEQTRIEWLESMGLVTKQQQTEGPVIVTTGCSFLIPIVYPGLLECKMFSGMPGRSSVESFYEMRVTGDDRLFAEGTAKMVWVNVDTGKSTPMPEVLRASCL